MLSDAAEHGVHAVASDGTKFLVLGGTTAALTGLFLDAQGAALGDPFAIAHQTQYFMHIGGHAEDAFALATGVRAMWDAIRQVREARRIPGERTSSKLPEITGKYRVGDIRHCFCDTSLAREKEEEAAREQAVLFRRSTGPLRLAVFGVLPPERIRRAGGRSAKGSKRRARSCARSSS